MDAEPSSTHTIRAAVVEDKPAERESLLALLNGSAGLSCVAACRSAEEAMERLPECQPDVVLMDINMPGGSGIDCVRALRPKLPNTQFMMLTVFEDHSSIFDSIKAGATGYLLKKAAKTELLEAIRDLHSGQSPISGQVARRIITELAQQEGAAPPAASPLSAGEYKVLQLLGRGLLYKEVADNLRISISTVRTHVYNIYRKLHVHNRTEAVLKGLRPLHR